MNSDKGRRPRRRDKRDMIGEGDFSPFPDDAYSPPPRNFGADNGGDNGSRGGGFGGGGSRGGGSRGGGMPAQVVGEGRGEVKFFNSQKGFGFISREDGGDDVFVHISAVERAGLESLAEGQGLEFTLVDRGGKVSASDLVIVGDVIEPQQRAPSRSGGGGFGGDRNSGGAGRPQREPTGERTSGTVKFFNDQKGFGFIERDDGKEDAFVHISAVERSGIGAIDQGDRLEFDVEIDRRGKFSATNLSALQN